MDGVDEVLLLRDVELAGMGLGMGSVVPEAEGCEYFVGESISHDGAGKNNGGKNGQYKENRR